MKVGILGAGSIADTVAATLVQTEGVELYAISSRNLEKAEAFRDKFNITKAYGSYEEMLNDEEVKLIYIATPHSHHYEHMKMCIEHGKAVLCEKAFTVNAAQAREIANLAKEKGVYVTEAIWPRYMPSRKLIDDTIKSGIIGNVKIMTANLSYTISQNARLVDPNLAGGALLDVGVYGINFMIMHFGKEIERIETAVSMTDTGVDGQESITIFFKDGKMVNLTHGIFVRSDRKGIFYGDKGYIVVENINNPQEINVFDLEDKLIKHIYVPKQISGYEYEFIESIRCIEEGKTESDSMPLDESIYMMELMDMVRDKWGFKYPFE